MKPKNGESQMEVDSNGKFGSDWFYEVTNNLQSILFLQVNPKNQTRKMKTIPKTKKSLTKFENVFLMMKKYSMNF